MFVWISKERRNSQLLITIASPPVTGETLKEWNLHIITKAFYPLVFGAGLGYKAKWQRRAFEILSFLSNSHQIYINGNFVVVVNNYTLDFWLHYLTFCSITDYEFHLMRDWKDVRSNLNGNFDVSPPFQWKKSFDLKRRHFENVSLYYIGF